MLLLVDSSSTVAGVLVIAASLVAMEADVVNVDGGEGGRFILEIGLENNDDDDDDGRCVLFVPSSSSCCCRSTVLSAVDLSTPINSSSK